MRASGDPEWPLDSGSHLHVRFLSSKRALFTSWGFTYLCTDKQLLRELIRDMCATLRRFSAFKKALADWNGPLKGNRQLPVTALTHELLRREILGCLVDLDSLPPQQVIYHPVCCKTSRAGAGIRVWPATEAMDHHKSALIECKLEKKTTLCVSIHHENKAWKRHPHAQPHTADSDSNVCTRTVKCSYGGLEADIYGGTPCLTHLHYKSQLNSILCLPVCSDQNLRSFLAEKWS